MTDNDHGFSRGTQARNFELFDRAGTKHFAAPAVGLAVLRRLIEQSGGTLTVESKEGHGASLVASVPFFANSDYLTWGGHLAAGFRETELTMLTISDPAGARMTQLLAAKREDTVLRIILRKRRMRLSWSLERPEDRTFQHDGRVVLVLDGHVSESLSRRKLDVRQTAGGPRLTLKATGKS